MVNWTLVDGQEAAPLKAYSRVLFQLRDLAQRYPAEFAQRVGEPTEAVCAQLLREGRQQYIGEGCWHCHSQFVRPVSNEDRRWGPVSRSEEYQNELQRPVLFGTRRVGPDLIRESGRRSNDWHIIHLFRPRLTAPDSVMPDYPWFFDPLSADGPGAPTRRGFALLTYIQWLGSWLEENPAASKEFHDHGGPR
jgi:cytochrome c oxidase cbb3-type subunit 2